MNYYTFLLYTLLYVPYNLINVIATTLGQKKTFLSILIAIKNCF